jgi:hypothetical protein
VSFTIFPAAVVVVLVAVVSGVGGMDETIIQVKSSTKGHRHCYTGNGRRDRVTSHVCTATIK